MKLGGISGNCDTCKGQGTVKKEEPLKSKAATLEEFQKIEAEQARKFTEEDAKYETEYLTPQPQMEFVPPSKNMDVSNGKHKRTKKQ
jgi:hypothetical protein